MGTEMGRDTGFVSSFLKASPTATSGTAEYPVTINQGVALAALENDSPDLQDSFWTYPQIQLARWNKLYPYQLLVLVANNNSQGQTTYRQAPGWQFTLPFPPESLNLSMPIASTVEATLGGIVEQNNGAPFREIQLTGSLGVFAGRESSSSFRSPGSLQKILGGSLSFLRNNALNGLNVDRAFNNESLLNPYTYSDDDFADSPDSNKSVLSIGTPSQSSQNIVAKSTGYYQLKQLEKFLEAYVLAKKTDSTLRLAFANWKDYQGQVTLVSPLHFSYRKSVPSGMEYSYQLSLRGWKRTPLNTFSSMDIASEDPNKLAKFKTILSTLTAVSILITDTQQFPGVLRAGQEAFQNLTEPLRVARVYSKSLLGASLSLADVPPSLQKQALSSYSSKVSFGQGVGNSGQVFPPSPLPLGLNSPGPHISPNSAPVQSLFPSQPSSSSQIDFVKLDSVSVTSLSVDLPIMASIQSDKNQIVHYSKFNWQEEQQIFKQAADQIVFALNAGSKTVADTYGILSPLTPHKNQPSDSDWEILWALDDALQAFDSLIANSKNTSTDSPVIDSMVQLTRRLGIAFQKPVSKFAVPMPYKMSLPQLANKYLGNPDRGIEIAILNGLKPPYLDEEGFQLPLLINGSGQNVTVDYDSRLYISQPVWLGSNSNTITRHHITNIKKGLSTLILTLDGDPTGLYKTRNQAYLHAYLPDTINSQSLVYIPSNQDPLNSENIASNIPGIDEFDPLVAVGGIDLALDSMNDLIIGPDGDGKYCWGLANIIQWTRIFLDIPLGQLQLHKEVGIGIGIGQSTADIQPGGLADSIRSSLIKCGIFSSIDKIQVSKNGPVSSVDIAASVFGYSQPIPISYQIKN
jgi:hypothetical protein